MQKRPFIITGGELTLEMLDLSFNKHSKKHDAPFQLPKRNNGIYLIDDFGRQKANPAEILNRWIVPMEKHVDYLSFQAGKAKMTVPFEAFLIFSTNLPSRSNWATRRSCAESSTKCSCEVRRRPNSFKSFPNDTQRRAGCRLPGGTRRAICKKTLHRRGIAGSAAAIPRDVITHAIDIIHFERLPMELTEDVLDRAFQSCFVESMDVND